MIVEIYEGHAGLSAVYVVPLTRYVVEWKNKNRNVRAKVPGRLPEQSVSLNHPVVNVFATLMESII